MVVLKVTVALAAALVLMAGCPSDAPPAADAGLDAPMGGDADAEVDLSGDTGPKTVAPQADPTAVAVKEWMVGWIPANVSPDPVLAAVRKGTFSYPKTGYDANKIHWSARDPHGWVERIDL